MAPGSKHHPYQQLEQAQKNAKSTLELLGVGKDTNKLIGELSAAAGGGAVLGAAGAAGAAGGEAAAGETGAGAGAGAGVGAGAARAAANAGLGAATKALAGASLLRFLSSGQNWIRLLEVIAGAVLIAMGLRQLTGAGNTVVNVAKTASKVVR